MSGILSEKFVILFQTYLDTLYILTSHIQKPTLDAVVNNQSFFPHQPKTFFLDKNQSYGYDVVLSAPPQTKDYHPSSYTSFACIKIPILLYNPKKKASSKFLLTLFHCRPSNKFYVPRVLTSRARWR